MPNNRMHAERLTALPPGTQAPADATINPPVATRHSILPFGELSWENFERLCVRVARTDSSIEHCKRFGMQGSAQEGIDIFARHSDGRYTCWQAKRHQRFGASDLRDTVRLFEEGSWYKITTTFIVAVQASLRTTNVQLAIEELTERLKRAGIFFQALDCEDLTDLVRDRPEVIDDFFGRGWVYAVLGSDVAERMAQRLDGLTFARLREQLRRVYAAQFDIFDPGSFGNLDEVEGRRALTILERFLPPDLLVREERAASIQEDDRSADTTPFGSRGAAGEVPLGPSRRLPTTQTRRIDVHNWLAMGERLAIIGDAGSGKSTLLRAIALDLLNQQSIFPELAERFGQALPLHVSFARWSREIGQRGSEIGLKDILRISLQPFLTSDLIDLLDRAIDERRILLLIDGLDEWSDEQAARTAMAGFTAMVQAHDIPTMVTGRPRGMARIGSLSSDWKRATIAPLSLQQQTTIAAKWFERHGVGVAGKGDPRSGGNVPPDLAASFMAELARERNLGALAETPLLLVGLITLSLRGQVLPRSRSEAFRQLTSLLLEAHPKRRATAAGDVRSRFRYTDDPDQRRAAVGYLAYSIRNEGGDAGFSVDRARSLLRDFLAASDGFAMEAGRANAAAGELLAVNSETQGLIIEKAPNEIGFAHSSFAEYLSAEYLLGLPFDDVQRFVGIECGNPRWRNVIVNLFSILQRRDEIDRVVATIEQGDRDALADANRKGLLAEAAFVVAGRSPLTARRLSNEAMNVIERGDWMPLREDALRSVLKGLGDPVLGPTVEASLAGWAPCRYSYRAGLIEAIGGWPACDKNKNVIWRAFHDEDRAVQHAAASSFVQLFAGDPLAGDRLAAAIRHSGRGSVAGAMLKSLLSGWSDHRDLEQMLEAAFKSASASLRLLAIGGLLSRGCERSTHLRNEILRLSSFWSELDYSERPEALFLLIRYWIDDDYLINGAVQRVDGYSPSAWDYSEAQLYLISCSTDHPRVKEWLLRALLSPRGLNTMGLSNAWGRIGQFAAADPKILEAAVGNWLDKEKHLTQIHQIGQFCQFVPDPRIRDLLIGIARGEESFQKHWAVDALVTGFSRSDPAVADLFDEIRRWPDARLTNLAAVLPAIETNSKLCRERLIRLSHDPAVRRDLIATGLEDCGCDGTDDAAVQAILRHNERAIFSPVTVLGRAFNKHPDAIAFSRTFLTDDETPWLKLIPGFEADDEIRETVLAAAVPLPVELRAVITETAVSAGTGTVLESILETYDLECDPELKARQSIAYHRALLALGRGREAMPKLERDLLAYGSSLECKRAAALAGATVLGKLDWVAALIEQNKHANIVVSTSLNPVPSVGRLVCENWHSLRAAFGTTLEDRLKAFNDDGISTILAEGAYLSEAASAEFLDQAESGILATGSAALRMLATLRPRSPLLLERCLNALDRGVRGNDNMMVVGEIALVLAEQFAGDAGVRNRLVQRMTAQPGNDTVLALALHSPADPSLRTLWPWKDDLGNELGQWATYIHMGAAFAEPRQFVECVEALVLRPYFTPFDAQKISNLAVQSRMRSDQEVLDLMRQLVHPEAHPSILASVPRYLATTGLMNESDRAKILDISAMLQLKQVVPIAGFDALANRVRSVRLSFLDALQIETGV